MLPKLRLQLPYVFCFRNFFRMKKKNWKLKLGLALIFLSIPIFGFLLIIPFLGVEGKEKIRISTITLILAEIVFWSGGLLVGKEMFSKYKSYMNPRNWFKKKSEMKEDIKPE